MSWVTPMALTPLSPLGSSASLSDWRGTRVGVAGTFWYGAAQRLTPTAPRREPSAPQIKQAATSPTPEARGLGSAQASSRWGWAEQHARAPQIMPISQSASRAVTLAAPTPIAIGSAIVGYSEPADELMSETRTAAPGLAQAIAEAALILGRDESAIWAEAAREWLSHHLGLVAIVADDANDDPPPTAPAAAVAARRATRCWSAIDALLADLRVPAA